MKVNRKQKIGNKDCKEIWEKHLDNLDTTKIITVSKKNPETIKKEWTPRVVTKRLLSCESSLCGDHLKTK